MDEVKAKLDSVPRLLKKQVCLVEEAEAVGSEGRVEEADVNFISGTGFQGLGNQGGNINSYGNRGNFNQSSQHQKPYSNNMGYGSFYYQKPPPPTQESKIEEMLDRVLEGQQRMTMDFNGKIDSVYTNLNTKFETLRTHVKKLDMQVVQAGEAIKRQGALTRRVEDDVMKHHVNAIIGDDFWQVVKEEKLQEEDFEVESLMSFGGSHWCRSMPSNENRSIEVIQNRSTSSPGYRSTKPKESTTSCKAVRIMTHEEFAVKHSHPPSPVYVNIDRHSTPPSIDIRRPSSIDNLQRLSIDEHLLRTECRCQR